MYLLELNIWLSLEAPSLVPLLKLCRVNGTLLALMPRYECNLRAWCRQKPATTLPELANALLQPTACLRHVFQHYGVLHLDLKPDNILVRHQGGTPLFEVCDWGTARAAEARKKSIGPIGLDVQSDLWAGTLPYMSPERLCGLPTSPAADVFGIGMMLFELLAGSLPFQDRRPIEDQVLDGTYWEVIRRTAPLVAGKRGADLMLQATHPDHDRRISDLGVLERYLRCLT